MKPKEKKAFEPTGLVPRSIVRTFERFRQQLLPGSERAAIREYRISRYQVLVSARCLFALLTIPIATNWFVSSWLLSPIIEHFWNTQQNEIFLNSYQEERAFAQLEFFSDKLFFESLLSNENDGLPEGVNNSKPFNIENSPKHYLTTSLKSPLTVLTTSITPSNLFEVKGQLECLSSLDWSNVSASPSTPHNPYNPFRGQGVKGLVEQDKEVYIPVTFGDPCPNKKRSGVIGVDNGHVIDLATQLSINSLNNLNFVQATKLILTCLPEQSSSYSLVDQIKDPMSSVIRSSPTSFTISPMKLVKNKVGINFVDNQVDDMMIKVVDQPLFWCSGVYQRQTDKSNKIVKNPMLSSFDHLIIVNSTDYIDGPFCITYTPYNPFGVKGQGGASPKGLGKNSCVNFSASSIPLITPSGSRGKVEQAPLPLQGQRPGVYFTNPFCITYTPYNPFGVKGQGGASPEGVIGVEGDSKRDLRQLKGLDKRNDVKNFLFYRSFKERRELCSPVFSASMKPSEQLMETWNRNTTSDSLKIKKRIQEKILELAVYYNQQTILSITNIAGDIISLLTLGCLFFWMKPEISILKSFLIEAIYSLSDTTKSFLLILLTDLLVGFHSPRGWETALELLLKHFGLPENQDFVFLFVATFPVLLDTVFKYWIFRHLNKISPSTVATYHSMIE